MAARRVFETCWWSSSGQFPARNFGTKQGQAAGLDIHHEPSDYTDDFLTTATEAYREARTFPQAPGISAEEEAGPLP